ncbi:MAG: hypothetical protein E7292_00430 [Lachnospiraceae bacterium]|nr:hypothetical protein [Lachnospiraceae bacterium]
MNSVQQIKEQKECCGCGICAAVCPAKSITMQISPSGKVEPCVGETCVSCGNCLAVCPQNMNVLGTASVENASTAAYVSCKLVQSKNEEILFNATSGGFVTTLVKNLLEKGEYDGAFLVDENHYGRVVQTRRIESGEDLSGTQKSRYVQISHTEEIAYILTHREERLILVGTPCYLKGFIKLVEKYKLHRDNFLLVGLFCDKTMTTHVWEYFDEIFGQGQLEAMHFRSKKDVGWPGDVRLFLQDGKELKLSRKERMEIKEYFMPECCLDCMDKLNPYADFSVGDDYVSKDADKKGGNSLIIRTQRGAAVWKDLQNAFEVQECTWQSIAQSQHLENREQDLQANRQNRLRKLRLGADRQYKEIRAEVLARRKRNSGFFRRVVARCKRIFK